MGLDVERDDGRQLRTASYAPTQSGTYYLQVTRVRDDQPVWRSGANPATQGGRSSLTNTRGIDKYQPVYAKAGANSEGLRNAFPYYEISVEVRGPTLSSIDDR